MTNEVPARLQPVSIPSSIGTDSPRHEDGLFIQTPTEVADDKQSNFFFLSEEKTVPEQLNNVEDYSLRRRQGFQSNVHELELAVANATAKLALERLNRDREMSQILPRHIFEPLERNLEDLQVHRQAHGATSQWVQLEGRLSALDTKMTHTVYVEQEDTRREKLEHYTSVLEHEIEPELKLQMFSADKREGGLVRRLEDLAGTITRRLHEEQAALRGSIQRVASRIHAMDDIDDRKGEAMLQLVRDLQARLEQEAAIRKEHDARILQLIARREAIMKEVLLDTVGTDAVWETSVSNLVLPEPEELVSKKELGMTVEEK